MTIRMIRSLSSCDESGEIGMRNPIPYDARDQPEIDLDNGWRKAPDASFASTTSPSKSLSIAVASRAGIDYLRLLMCVENFGIWTTGLIGPPVEAEFRAALLISAQTCLGT